MEQPRNIGVKKMAIAATMGVNDVILGISVAFPDDADFLGRGRCSGDAFLGDGDVTMLHVRRRCFAFESWCPCCVNYR